MLIREDRVGRRFRQLLSTAVADLLTQGRDDKPTERIGVYEIGHFNGLRVLDGYEEYPMLSIEPYGVCDSVEQILAAESDIEGSATRKFVITLTPVVKSEQPAHGGWRWHKWGPYIGIQTTQCEYIADEPDIEQVFVYHIYEQKLRSEGWTYCQGQWGRSLI